MTESARGKEEEEEEEEEISMDIDRRTNHSIISVTGLNASLLWTTAS